MSQRYAVDVDPVVFPYDLEQIQIVFHGINKSGSLAMANVLGEAYQHTGRASEFISHYHTVHTVGKTDVFIERLNASVRARRSFVVSHYLFGALKPANNRVWVTMFRHPLPRIVSCYQWLKVRHESKLKTPYGSLEDFVLLRGRKGTAHSQVGQFGAGYGPNGPLRWKRMSAQDMFEISIDQIAAHVGLIGIAEYFEESIFAFAALCGFADVVPWSRDTRNKGRRSVGELTEHEVALIREHYHYDFLLYEHVLARFREQSRGLGIESASLQAYREACRSQYNDRILSG